MKKKDDEHEIFVKSSLALFLILLVMILANNAYQRIFVFAMMNDCLAMLFYCCYFLFLMAIIWIGCSQFIVYLAKLIRIEMVKNG
jgi:hypothetical protein